MTCPSIQKIRKFWNLVLDVTRQKYDQKNQFWNKYSKIRTLWCSPSTPGLNRTYFMNNPVYTRSDTKYPYIYNNEYKELTCFNRFGIVQFIVFIKIILFSYYIIVNIVLIDSKAVVTKNPLWLAFICHR